MSDKLNIQNEMRVFDRKDRTFYDSLTDEERKKFSNFLMIRWGSSVEGSKELQEFYLIATNERFNKNFFAINRHPKLQWLAATTVSPGLGTHRHTWIAPKKKETGASAIRKQLAELYPHYKDDEIELMAKLNTKKDIDEHLKKMGREK
jgi:ABC-type Zn uptake system ZnuABC Zn-binding protein ZnuA